MAKRNKRKTIRVGFAEARKTGKPRKYDLHKGDKRHYHITLDATYGAVGYYTRAAPRLGVTRFWYKGSTTGVTVFVDGVIAVTMHVMKFDRLYQAREAALSRCLRGFRVDMRGAKAQAVLNVIDGGEQ